jgi:hypothetical protein
MTDDQSLIMSIIRGFLGCVGIRNLAPPKNP